MPVTSAPACTSNVFHDGLVADVTITSPGSNVAIATVGSSTTSAAAGVAVCADAHGVLVGEHEFGGGQLGGTDQRQWAGQRIEGRDGEGGPDRLRGVERRLL